MQTQTHIPTYSHKYTYTYKLMYLQPLPYINTSTNLNTHAHGLTCTHKSVWTQENSVPNIFLYFHHINSIVCVSANPNPDHNPNPGCWTFIHKKNPNPKPKPNLKFTKNRVNLKKSSLISDSTEIFLLTRRTITPPSKIPSQIPDLSLLVTSCLTQPEKHVHP